MIAVTDKLPGLHMRIPPQPITERQRPTPVSRPETGGAAFQEILKKRLDTSTLKFSGHAQARLRLRGIQLDAEQLRKLEEAVDKAAAKGSRDTLVVMNGNVFVVSVRNRTVITVVDRDSARENVFTQIDSAVLTD